MNVKARIPYGNAGEAGDFSRWVRLPGATRAPLTEQRVDVFFGNFGEGRIERKAHFALAVDLAVNYVKDRIHFRSGTFHPQAHQSEAGTLVENDDQYHPVRYDRNVNVVALAFMRQDWKALLADQMRQPVGRGNIAGRQACEAGGVEVEHLSVRRDLLAIFIDQENELGVRIRAQARDDVLEQPIFLFVHYDRSRHSFSLNERPRQGERCQSRRDACAWFSKANVYDLHYTTFGRAIEAGIRRGIRG